MQTGNKYFLLDSDVNMIDNKVSIADFDFSRKLTFIVSEIADDLKANSCIISQEWTDKGFEYCSKINILVEDTIAKDESEYYHAFCHEIKSAQELFSNFCKENTVNEFYWRDIEEVKTTENIEPKSEIDGHKMTVLQYSFFCKHKEKVSCN